MVKEYGRKCSHCGHLGHNTRTCNNGNGNDNGVCLKLFGVNIMEKRDDNNVIKKSFSMGNLTNACDIIEHKNITSLGIDDFGYLSDGVIHNGKHKASQEKKRGKPWTEEEHRTFLAGLKKLGKGDWRGISKQFVITRTPAQVASHAQKYFLRQQAANDKRKRRSSLFDMPFHDTDSSQNSPISLNEKATDNIVSRFPQLCLDKALKNPTASFRISNHPGIPFMFGMPGSESLFPVMNLERIRYHQNNGPTAVIVHPSGIPSPRSPLTSSPLNSTGHGASPPERDLDLKIGLPQSSQTSELSTPSISVT